MSLRPNLIVGGDVAPFDEDSWAWLAISGQPGGGSTAKLEVVKPCTRCKIPTIDQQTGIPDRAVCMRTPHAHRHGA